MILVTGSTGIVGTRLVFDMLRKGKTVRAMRRDGSDLEFMRTVFRFYDPDQGDSLFEKLEWVQGDLTDIFSLEEAMKGVQTVYHAAALVSYAAGDAKKLIELNGEGTANVVNAALDAGINKFCHISSVAALGRPANGSPATEKNWWKKSTNGSVYGLSKYMAEREVWRGASEGLPTVIVNPAIVLGPAKSDQSSGMLMALLRKGVPYFPKGSAGYVDVRDVSAMAIDLMDSEISNERFILCSETESFRNMLNMSAAIYGNKKPTFAIHPWMLSIVWRLAWFGLLISGAQPRITKETARSSSLESRYENEKIKAALGRDFIKTQVSLEYYSGFYQ